MKPPRIYSKQFPAYVKRPEKYGLYELNTLVIERPAGRYNELMAEKKRMVSKGIKPLYLTIKPIR